MPDSNHLQSLIYLMDCFIHDYYDKDVVKDISELDLRAQIEVGILQPIINKILWILII